MAAKFVAASSRYILNSTAILTAVPFTVGLWVYPTQTAALQATFSIASSTVANNYWSIEQNLSTSFDFVAKQGGTTGTAAVTTTITVNQWYFLLARFISATNRRGSVLRYDGGVVHGNNTTSSTPGSIDRMAIGSRVAATIAAFFDGSIGEYWITNTDIQLDGLATQDETLRQLAYGGPFSIPHIGASVIEYRSLRKHPSSDGDDPNEIFSSVGQKTWVNTNGVTIGEHPPLPYWYVRPRQIMRNMVI